MDFLESPGKPGKVQVVAIPRPQHAKPARRVRAIGQQQLLDLRTMRGKMLPVGLRGKVEPRLHVADGVGGGIRRHRTPRSVDFQYEVRPVQQDAEVVQNVPAEQNIWLVPARKCFDNNRRLIAN